MHTVLLVDDDKAICKTLHLYLTKNGFDVKIANNGKTALDLVSENRIDLVLLDINLPDGNGIEFMQKLHKLDPGIKVIIITGMHSLENAVDAIKNGAYDYIKKPLNINEITLAIEKLKRRRKTFSFKNFELSFPYEASDIMIGSSRVMIEIMKQIGAISNLNTNVLITGETGTGKEMIARAIHSSCLSDEPFVAVNCSAIVPGLFESELFGHKKGAFTGAVGDKLGKLEVVGKGVLFLDEISDLPLDMQVKFLRVIQEREFIPVGSNEIKKFEGRIIAATNRDLKRMIEKKRFREDLFYRLTVSEINIPPLRERRDDIPELVNFLANKIGKKLHKQFKGIEEKSLKEAFDYDWPGNIRELENLLTRAIIASYDGIIRNIVINPKGEPAEGEVPSPDLSMNEVEEWHIRRVLDRNSWNITRSSKTLGITRATLMAKIKKYDISRQETNI